MIPLHTCPKALDGKHTLHVSPLDPTFATCKHCHDYAVRITLAPWTWPDAWERSDAERHLALAQRQHLLPPWSGSQPRA